MKRVTLLIILLLSANNLLSQKVLSTSGGTGGFEGYAVNWSIGEVVTETFSIGGVTVNQGFNQYSETIKNVSTIKGYETINVKAYPNPTTNFINIRISDIEINGLLYKITTLEGRIIMQGYLYNEETIIDFVNLSPTIYLLTILNNGIVVRSFRIVKIK